MLLKEMPLVWLTPWGQIRYNYPRLARELLVVEPLPEPSGLVFYLEDEEEEPESLDDTPTS